MNIGDYVSGRVFDVTHGEATAISIGMVLTIKDSMGICI